MDQRNLQFDHRISTWPKEGAIFPPRHTDTSPNICLRLSNGDLSIQVIFQFALLEDDIMFQAYMRILGEFGTRCIESRLRVHLVIH